MLRLQCAPVRLVRTSRNRLESLRYYLSGEDALVARLVEALAGLGVVQALDAIALVAVLACHRRADNALASGPNVLRVECFESYVDQVSHFVLAFS